MADGILKINWQNEELEFDINFEDGRWTSVNLQEDLFFDASTMNKVIEETVSFLKQSDKNTQVVECRMK